MILRPATLDDVPALAQLGTASFTKAFGDLYSPADLNDFLATSRSESKAHEDICDPARRIQLAEENGTLFAYCQIIVGQGFPEYLRPDNPRPKLPIKLDQLYCAPAATARGIGTKLMDWSLETARSLGADEMQLSVYCKNFGAQRFYQRYGFRKVADIHYWVGNQRDDEFLYVLDL